MPPAHPRPPCEFAPRAVQSVSPVASSTSGRARFHATRLATDDATAERRSQSGKWRASVDGPGGYGFYRADTTIQHFISKPMFHLSPQPPGKSLTISPSSPIRLPVPRSNILSTTYPGTSACAGSPRAVRAVSTSRDRACQSVLRRVRILERTWAWRMSAGMLAGDQDSSDYALQREQCRATYYRSIG